MNRKAPKNQKKSYRSPCIRTENIEEVKATSMGGGGGGSTCNGNTNGGRKDSATSGCSTLLT